MTRSLTLILIASLGTTVGAQVIVAAPNYTVEKFDVGGQGGTAYITAEPGTDRVFLSRQSRVMIVDGRSGKLLGEIPETPGVRGIALAFKWSRGFTTNAGDSTVSMFDLQTLAVIKKIKIPVGGLDRITYDGVSDRIIVTSTGRPRGFATVIDPKSGTVIGKVDLDDTSPEAAVSDDRGRIYVANGTKNTVQVFDVNSRKVLHTWPVAPCVGPTGLGWDPRTDRLFVGCSKKSVAMDGSSGKVVASWENGDGVDGLAWDAGDHLVYIPSGRSGSITVVRMVSLNSYKVVKTIPTLPRAKTIAHDPASRVVYQFQPDSAGAWFVRISR